MVSGTRGWAIGYWAQTPLRHLPIPNPQSPNKIIYLMDTDESSTKKSEINDNINKDKTFNKLKEIQELLKKESALNDLCKLIMIVNL